MKKLLLVLIFAFISSIFLSACGGGGEREFEEEGPLKYRFLSSAKVEVVYGGKTYMMNRYGDNDVPFRYDFEDDGDLNIYIGGRSYDLDSPYDIEYKKKKKKKKVVKKKDKYKKVVKKKVKYNKKPAKKKNKKS